MAENEKIYHAPVREFDNNKSLITRIGFTANSDEKFEIVWDIPATDEEAKSRYDCELKDLVVAGIRQFSTRPNYKDVGFDEDGTLKAEGHEAMQIMADGYQVGRQATGISQKAVVAKVKAAESELGMTHDEMVAKMKEMKEAGLLD